MCAASHGRRECVRALLEAGASVDKMDDRKSTAIVHAIEMDHSGCIEEMLQHGAQVDLPVLSGRTTALFVAAEHGSPMSLRILLDGRADVNFATHDGVTPLIAACKTSKIRSAECSSTGGGREPRDRRATTALSALSVLPV